MYLNKEKIVDSENLEDFQDVVHFTFSRYGVDYLHPTFNLDAVREKFYYYLKSKNKIEVETKRLKEMFENDSIFKSYIDSRVNFSNKFLSKTNQSGT